jgi:diaminohydroxyphosphoribosylaminopyrimidine deaminase/5-amino-6-(5-phosphoribosylamino)uracil reductase
VRDDELMGRAIALARSARRHTAPKPAVGCVIVRDGEIVGEGATEPSPRGAHAEVVALRAAGDRARGATLYSTLEPCDHHGTTPPCTSAVIDAGIVRVVAAVDDPDERVAGRGFARLRGAGIDVVTGVGEAEATRDLAPYLHHRRTGRAFVSAKIASTLDGRVAAADGSSRWITSDAARADAHELRADAQAIVVGAGTALADRPALTVRGVAMPPARPPLRVLLDAHGRVPAEGPLFDTALAPTLVITTDQAKPDAVDAWRSAGAKVETVAPGARGVGVDLDAALALLGSQGVLHALVEGGGTLLGAFVAGGYARRLVAYVAPALLGTSGVPAFAFPGPATIDGALRFDLIDVTRFGPDVRLEYEMPAGWDAA